MLSVILPFPNKNQPRLVDIFPMTLHFIIHKITFIMIPIALPHIPKPIGLIIFKLPQVLGTITKLYLYHSILNPFHGFYCFTNYHRDILKLNWTYLISINSVMCSNSLHGFLQLTNRLLLVNLHHLAYSVLFICISRVIIVLLHWYSIPFLNALILRADTLC